MIFFVKALLKVETLRFGFGKLGTNLEAEGVKEVFKDDFEERIEPLFSKLKLVLDSSEVREE